MTIKASRGPWKWLGLKRETSRSGIKWEVGGAIWLHDKTAEGKAKRLIAAVHLGFWTGAIAYELTPSQEAPAPAPPPPPPHCSRGRASGDACPDETPAPPGTRPRRTRRLPRPRASCPAPSCGPGSERPTGWTGRETRRTRRPRPPRTPPTGA